MLRAEWIDESDDVLAFCDRGRQRSCATWSACWSERCSAASARAPSATAGGPPAQRGGGDRRPPTAFTWSRCATGVPSTLMKVLLTNDDGITATGLNVLRRALLEVPGIELAVIAPDSNRSATARSITFRQPLWVEEVEFGDGTSGFATDGTPVDCVRFAALGLLDFEPELIVSGHQPRRQPGRRHHLLGHGRRRARGRGARPAGDRRLPAGRPRRDGLPRRARLEREDFEQAAGVHRPAGRGAGRRADAGGHAAQRQRPGRPPAARACRLGKRIYRDRWS